MYLGGGNEWDRNSSFIRIEKVTFQPQTKVPWILTFAMKETRVEAVILAYKGTE